MTPLLTKFAMEHPPTAAGYKRLAANRTAWLVCMTISVTVCVACVEFGLAAKLMGCILLMATPGLCVTLGVYVRRQRVAAVLQAYPWQEVPYWTVPGSPPGITIPFAENYVPTFTMLPFPEDFTDGSIWFAGDPRFGGVVSPVGGHRPVRAVLSIGSVRAPTDGSIDGDDDLARTVGIMRRSGKGTQS